MTVLVEKLTDESLLHWACGMTIDAESNMSLERIYRNEHSPMRTQIFKISMLGIPTFVSTHFVRHNIGGIVHFVKTQRDDRLGDETEGTAHDRWTPTNHGILCNSQVLINIARKRLCHTSHWATRKVMRDLKDAIYPLDPALYQRMVPECIYRGGVCHEDRICGKRKNVKHWKEVELDGSGCI